MKLAELKKKFKSRYSIRIIAGVLVVALVGTGASTYQVSAAREAGKTAAAVETTEESEPVEKTETENALSDALNGKLTLSEKEIGKEETVYIIADNTGSAKEVIVSDHLINNDDKATIEDASTLTDIKNVKGDETFTQNGSKLVWQADGNDIYYQGTGDAKTPVTQKMTYFLDGKEITPEDLAGKSGKVTIRFDYINNEKVKATIDGDEEEICVPFVAISGMVLDESFRDIEVKNGKVVADGNNSVVIGYALPGLTESLNVQDGDFDAGIDIPEYVEVTADVENFSLDMTMTVAMNATNFISADGSGDISSLDDMLGTLTDATEQLQDGSAELADGVDTLKSKMGEFKDGVGSLKSGIVSYTDGANTLSNGIGTLKDGVDTLAGSVPALTSGVEELKSGAETAVTGAGSLSTRASELAAGAKTVSDGASVLNGGVATLVGKLNGVGSSLANTKAGLYTQFAASGVAYENAPAALQQLAQKQQALVTGLLCAANGDTAGAATYFAAAGVADATAASQEIINVTTQIASLQAGVAGVDSASQVIDAVAGQLSGEETQAQIAALQQGAGDLASGAASVSDGAARLAVGAASLKSGLDTLDGGIGTLKSSTAPLVDGANQLKNGTDQLANGASTLVANNQALRDGATKLSDGTDAITEGVGALAGGAHELADGIVTFNEEGIEKILNSYNGDVQPLIDRLQAVLDAGEEYQSYTGIADGVNGSVKFIYKTAAIKAD